jgi:Flp pilus assembly protein CpaB
MSISTTTSKKKMFQGGNMWFIFAALASVTVAIISFGIMQTVTATDTYYVLSKSVPARTQITPDLLEEKTTSAGKTPPTALDISEITEDTFSLYSLQAGDILTTSNTGAQLSVTEGLPKDFVVASFPANPSIAAGGKIKRGDYIDIMVVSDGVADAGDGFKASYALQRVLVVDATIDLDGYEGGSDEATTATEDGTTTSTGSAESTDAIAQRTGIPTLFSVGLSQADAARLAVATQYDLFVVLSSSQSANDNNVSSTPGSAITDQIFTGESPNAGAGTDNTFGQGGTPATTSPSETGGTTPGATPTPTPSSTGGTTTDEEPTTTDETTTTDE